MIQKLECPLLAHSGPSAQLERPLRAKSGRYLSNSRWVYLKHMVIDYYFFSRHNEDVLIKNLRW